MNINNRRASGRERCFRVSCSAVYVWSWRIFYADTEEWREDGGGRVGAIKYAKEKKRKKKTETVLRAPDRKFLLACVARNTWYIIRRRNAGVGGRAESFLTAIEATFRQMNFSIFHRRNNKKMNGGEREKKRKYLNATRLPFWSGLNLAQNGFRKFFTSTFSRYDKTVYLSTKF